ncbi:MAG: hypothetical protein J07HQX50_00599 [Haloquadratum sp. J07HQX50]|nr:MAG: hypothetical protein J07HQX50_00599 [Haloquadratum sp. J07HQX50]
MECLEKFASDVLARVVVRVQFVLALLTQELVLRPPIVLVCKPTRRTPLTRVRRTHLFDLKPEHLGFVLGVLVEVTERP